MENMENLKSNFNNYSSNRYISGSKEFLQSNSIVAKFAFLILVLIVFMMCLRIGSFILGKILSHDKNPVLIDGMINARQMMIIPQDPSKKGSVPILRSVNEREGIEFTWSVWIFVNDFGIKEHEMKHVFHKGNDRLEEGTNFPNNAPGLYITPRIENGNKGDMAGLKVIMNSFEKINEEITITDLPLHKWVNVIIRISKQNNLDVYINGLLVKRHILSGVPRQNYGDVYVAMNGGFDGNISDLRYFEKAIGTSKIQSLLKKGPSTNIVGSDMNVTNKEKKYLSTRWYMKTATDTF